MPLVIDVSMAAGWILPDEASAEADLIFDRLPYEDAFVPPLFWLEARNMLVTAERRQRILPGSAVTYIEAFRALPVTTMDDGKDDTVLSIATSRGLSAYDATYIALAISTKAGLATLDGRLAAACKAQGLEVVGPLSIA